MFLKTSSSLVVIPCNITYYICYMCYYAKRKKHAFKVAQKLHRLWFLLHPWKKSVNYFNKLSKQVVVLM